IGKDVELETLLEDSELLPQTRLDACPPSAIERVAEEEERVDPVDCSQRERVRLPAVAATRLCIPDPGLGKSREALHESLIAGLAPRQRQVHRIVEIVEIVTPEMADVAPAPIHRVDRLGPVEESERPVQNLPGTPQVRGSISLPPPAPHGAGEEFGPRRVRGDGHRGAHREPGLDAPDRSVDQLLPPK